MKRYIAVYDSLARARDAVNDLISSGYPAETISLVAYDVEDEYAPYIGDETEGAFRSETAINETRLEDPADEVAEGAGIGALIGGLGGLLLGLSALTIPGVGPVIAAGPIATALAGGAIGAAGGAATGALIEAMVEMGVERSQAEYYAESVRRGGAMVTVETAAVDTTVNEILHRHRPIDVERSAESWRERGWQGWEEEAEPYRDVDRERDFYYSDQ